jgi:hypothetical protein
MFAARSSSNDIAVTKLHTEEEIGMYDVLCGRDKAAFNNAGNRRFRVVVSSSLDRYLQASTRKDKSAVIRSVVTMLYSAGGKFLQEVPNKDNDRPLYTALNEKQAHEKAGHALRDMASLRSKSSLSTIIKKKKEVEQSFLLEDGMPIKVAPAQTQKRIRKKPRKVQHVDLGLPSELDSWTNLTLDEYSEPTADEAVFDNLVKMVVINCVVSDEANEVREENASGLTMLTCDELIMDTSTLDAVRKLDLVVGSLDVESASVDTNAVSKSRNDAEEANEGLTMLHDLLYDELIMDASTAHSIRKLDSVLCDFDVESTSEESNAKSNSRVDDGQSNQISTDFFQLDDQTVSWLIGECDCVLQF